VPGLLQNLRYGLRGLRKAPGFTIVAVITLALGIGANTAIFSVVYAALIAPLPYPNPDRLVMVWSKIQGDRNVVAAGDFLDWKRQNTVFQDLNAWTGATYNLSTPERPEQVEAQMTTPGFYTTMGVKFAMGRDFSPEEGQPGKDHEVILFNRLWQRLGARPDIIGQQLRCIRRHFMEKFFSLADSKAAACETVVALVKRYLEDGGVQLLPDDIAAGPTRALRFRPSMGWVHTRA